MNLARTALALGATAGLAGVALGAFGSHVLSARLDARGRRLWRTAEHYQFVHALALVLVGMTAGQDPAAGAVAWLFVAGILAFCGSLYGLGLGGPRWLGMAAPLGGLALLAGWALWAWSFFAGF